MQVIHHYNGFYPFQLQQQCQQTYLEVLKESLTQQQISLYRTRYKALKEMDHTNLMKLVRVYKEESTLHLLYEYFPLSFEKYAQYRRHISKQREEDEYATIYEQFVGVLTSIVHIFIKYQIKTDIIFHNFAVTDLSSGTLKLFIDTQPQFITPTIGKQVSQQSLPYIKEYLDDFYIAQQKRLTMQLQQLLQKYFGKRKGQDTSQPNFIINGTKLIFIKQNNQTIGSAGQTTANMMKLENKASLHEISPMKTQISEIKRTLKKKTLKRLTEIKGFLNRFQTKPMPHQSQFCIYPLTADQVMHGPEQATNSNTTVQQQDGYEQALQDQIDHSNHAKLQQQQRQNEQKRATIIKQISQLQQRNKKYSQMLSNDHKGSTHHQRVYLQGCRDSQPNIYLQKTPSNIKFCEKSANSAHSSDNQQQKDQKENKYKMKITTSHQIEIEGEPQTRNIKIGQDIAAEKITQQEISAQSQRPEEVNQQLERVNDPADHQNASNLYSIMMHSRASDTASKSRKINQIIEKINSKISMKQLSNSSHSQQQNQTAQGLSSYNLHLVTPAERPQQTYYDKIREAKTKAEQVLKEYAKKRR